MAQKPKLLASKPDELRDEHARVLVGLLVQKLGGHVLLTEREIALAHESRTQLFVEQRVGSGLILEVVPNGSSRRSA